MELNRQIPFGDVVVNLSSRILSKGEKNVELSKKEMDLRSAGIFDQEQGADTYEGIAAESGVGSGQRRGGRKPG